MPLVSSGVEHGNLRELALARMKDMGTEVRLNPKDPSRIQGVGPPPPQYLPLSLQCRDVRTREVGIQEIHHKVRPYQVTGGFVCGVWGRP